MKVNKQRLETDKAPAAVGAYSPGIAVPNSELVIVSGQIGLNPEGQLAEGIEAQTKQTLSNLAAVLAVKDCTFDNVVKTDIFIADGEYYRVVNEVYEQVLSEVDIKPTRACVVAQVPYPGALVEMSMMAVTPVNYGL